MDWSDEVRRESYIQYIPLVLQINVAENEKKEDTNSLSVAVFLFLMDGAIPVKAQELSWDGWKDGLTVIL